MEDRYFPPQSPTQTGMAGRCPRCGQGNLFSGYLTIADRCAVCDLDYTIADSGDGPAVFVIFITGFAGVLAAFILRYVFSAPPWLVLLLAGAFTIGLTLLLLRPMKGTLFALQYRNKAAEGRLE